MERIGACHKNEKTDGQSTAAGRNCSTVAVCGGGGSGTAACGGCGGGGGGAVPTPPGGWPPPLGRARACRDRRVANCMIGADGRNAFGSSLKQGQEQDHDAERAETVWMSAPKRRRSVCHWQLVKILSRGL